MYNRILKRPMFKRGGSSFQAQGTGITSPYDPPRGGYYGGGTIGGGAIRGNPMGYRTGFDDPKPDTFEQIDIETKALEAPKKGEWSGDVMQYLSALSNPYKDDGTAKTIGEMGYEGAEQVRTMREEREARRKLASLEGLQTRKDKLIRTEEQEFEMNKLAEEQKGDLATRKTIQELANTGALNVAEIQNSFEKTATGGMIREIKNRKDLNQDQKHKMIEAIILKSNRPQLIVNLAKAIIDNATADMKEMKLEDAMKQATNAIMLMMVDVGLPKARGGRVGYQLGTPQTGAMPIQASTTETIDTPTADFTETETVTEGQQGSVQMPYQEFRAALPAEVSDEIVQLIYYNQDAFADFAQISTQADVYAFNNKYGVSLVLPMDTETT